MIQIIIIFFLFQPVNYQIQEQLEIQSKKEYLRVVTSEDILDYRNDEDVRHVYLFYHPHCPWCVETEQELIKMSKELQDVEFYKINCYLEKDYCQQMNVHHVPTIYVFKNYVQRKCFDREYNYLKKFIMKY